ncbi:MAG: hypothetical protein IPK96_12000 [Flammeovirgaceae bacterium]|nr:hypothetical protein [Flammeovirgaceae bacterium]
MHPQGNRANVLRHGSSILQAQQTDLFYLAGFGILGPETDTRNSNEKGTSLGFNQGYLMSNEDGVLKAEGRKQVYVLYLKSIKDLDENHVRALLFEAAMIDDQFVKKKK